ncbi:ATP-binding protein [Hyalangium minutum]|uniref:histidine kinase n=1 Tax=Hyalangium minutum TaxID=394096 RepID=A0A085WEC0_9BACT|nr:ATP-binding protein [Hyalangium minutum]KFE66033.1 Sensory box histidine kinase [Hyalangium minutum]
MLEQEPRPQGWEPAQDPEEPHRLAAFLRAHREELLADWKGAAHELHSRHGSGEPLGEHLSALLDGITEALAHEAHGIPLQLPGVLSEVHALARLSQGFALHEITHEYGLLRGCILRRLQASAIHPAPGTLALLDELIDQATMRAVQSYSRLRERTLNALDGMMQAALDSPDEDTLLQRLLTLLMESAMRVDSAIILLREDGTLRVRAAQGLEAAKLVGQRMRVGEGFAGRVAAERRPLAVRSASTDPLLKEEALGHLDLHALYGLPLMDGDYLFGVAYMGSRTAYAFSEADMLVFRIMASRATALIVQAQLHAREQAAREEAQRSLAMVNTLLATSPVGIAFLDKQLRYLRVNKTLADINHVSVEGHLGRSVREVLPAPVVTQLEPLLQRVLETGEPSGSFEFTAPAGLGWPPDRTWLTSYYPVRTEAGSLMGAGCVVLDITERKQAEQALERAISFREQLLAVLGHDLRNPLGAISASAFLLSRAEGLGEREHQAVERIRRSSARMARLIDDILDFARSRLGGGIPVTRQPMNMAEVCKAALEELQVTFPERQLLFEVRGDTQGEWDPDRVSQVLSNLVFNALQHGREDSPVRTMVRDAGAQVLLEVHNQGDPIPEELMPRLFDPFKRRPGDQRPHEGKSGARSLGLGLHIVRQIALSHGGDVEVHSTANEGTCFKVRWPRRLN